MKITTAQDRILFNLFEEKLTDISQKVGYGGEEVSSEKHRVFESAWEEYLRELGVLRTLEVVPYHPTWRPDWIHLHRERPRSPSEKTNVILGDPLYTTGKWLDLPKDLALKILALNALP